MTFEYKGWSLFDAISAIKAYDHGALDSGVRDDAMKEAVRLYLGSLDPEDFRRTCAEFAQRYLSEEGIANGYGVDDVVAFSEWLSELEEQH